MFSAVLRNRIDFRAESLRKTAENAGKNVMMERERENTYVKQQKMQAKT